MGWLKEGLAFVGGGFLIIRMFSKWSSFRSVLEHECILPRSIKRFFLWPFCQGNLSNSVHLSSAILCMGTA